MQCIAEKGCSNISNFRLLVLEYSNLWLACLKVKLKGGGAADVLLS